MTDPQKPGMPTSMRRGLRDADPFANPSPAATAATPGKTPHPGGLGPRPGEPGPARPSGQDTGLYPCPCACDCGGETSVPAADIESAAAATWLRCQPCTEAGHLSAAYNKPHDDHPTRPIEVRHSWRDDEQRELDRIAAAEIEQIRREEAKARFYAELPPRWRDVRPDDTLEPQVEDRLHRMANRKGDHALGLLCVGTFGGGKTWVGYSYVREAIERNLLWPTEVRYGTEGDLMRDLAYAGYDLPREVRRLLNPRYKMILMDDVGTTGIYPDKDKRHSLFSQVFDWIYERRLALVLTTNLMPGQGKDLEQWIGPAAYQRMRNIVGPDAVVRNTDKRAELTAAWEAEYRESLAGEPR